MSGTHQGMGMGDFYGESMTKKRPLDEEEAGVVGSETGSDVVPTWPVLLYDYTQNATLHGISYVTGEGTFIIRKIVWFLLVSGALSFFIYYASDRISLFLSYPKNVNVEVNYLTKVKFPTVTFCNQNTFRLTAAANNKWYDIVKKLAETGVDGPESPKCTQFQCDKTKCISTALQCDLFPDCEDGSDELNCGTCPLILINGSDALITAYPQMIGYYQLQPNTSGDSVPFYAKTGGGSEMYLYYSVDHWAVGEIYQDSRELLYTDPINHTVLPDKVTSPWKALNGAENTSVTCETKNTGLRPSSESIVYDGITLEDLYRKTAHEKATFVESCTWKGQDCVNNIKEVLTDLGVCYTFRDEQDMFIEQSGPGYGLIMTLNIEYYEYTKAGDAAGVKLLLHQDDDVPIVSERGVAISPGLYSFISVESTTVQNLEPPYGLCGETPLSYFDSGSYSIAKCKMQKETDHLDSKCGCRDFHQPFSNGKPQVCDVSTYTNCSKENLELLKKSGNYSECLTPCSQEEYVPTTSFAILLKADGSDMGEVKLTKLRKSLFAARETSYRVVTSKYMASLREFHDMSERLNTMNRFLKHTLNNLKHEYDTLYTLAATMTYDCIWVRDELRDARAQIVEHALQPLDKYRDLVTTRIYHTFQELTNVVNEVNSNYDNNWPNGTYATQAEYRAARNADVLRLHHHIQTALSNTGYPDGPYVTLDNTADSEVNNMPDSHIFLNKTMIDPMREFISETGSCTWCVNNNDILGTIKTDVKNALTYVQSRMNTVRSELNSMYWEYLDDLKLLDGDVYVKGNYSYRHNIIDNRIDQAMNKLDSTVEKNSQAPLFLDHLVDFQWLLHCQAKTGVTIEDYRGQDVQLRELLELFKTNIETEAAKWNKWTADYIANTEYVKGQTLEAFGDFKFDDVVTFAQRQQTRLETALNDRLQTVDLLKSQFSSINYVLKAVIEQSQLAGSSEYWRRFSITDPHVNLPVSLTLPQGGQVPETYYGIQTDTDEEKFWKDIKDNLENMKKHMQTQVEDLVKAVQKAKTYITAYVDGNKLSASFYGENFLQVEIFYKELTERKVSQQKAYAFENLLSEIGGLMGLLMGASVLSICEVLDLFVYNSARKIYNRRTRTHPSPNNKQAWQ